MKKIVVSLTLLAAPLLAFAQGTVVSTEVRVLNADSLFSKVNGLLNSIIPILLSVAVVYLIFSIVRYVIAGNEEEKKAGKGMIVWGIIGLFVILSIWGLVNILVRTLGLDNQVQQNQLPSTLPINQRVGGI